MSAASLPFPPGRFEANPNACPTRCWWNEEHKNVRVLARNGAGVVVCPVCDHLEGWPRLAKKKGTPP